MAPAVSILITTWNGIELVRDCLGAVAARTAGIDYETIVVDDASTDETAAMLGRDFPAVRLLVRPINGGFVRANNDGVRAARGQYVFLLNSDTLLLNNAVKILADYLDANPGVGVCGGWLTDRDGSSQVSYGDPPSLAQALADALFLNDLFPALGLPNRGVAPRAAAGRPMPVGYITGADLMIRRSLVERIGLFDERYEAYCEEVDLCRRVRTAGGSMVHFVPEARICHLGGYSYGKRGKRHVQLQSISTRRYLVKHHGALYATLVLALYAWHYAVKGAVRSLRVPLSSPGHRVDRRAAALGAWYRVRYSLRPGGGA
ncbi:MAG TPA: glycosyltransferase family 2 protein [Bacteroidota bacterium]|nr:glycosyltransferase family 2 protein [Bacteroidota bacterium]